MYFSISFSLRFIDDFDQQRVNVLGRIVIFKKKVPPFVDPVDQQAALEVSKTDLYLLVFHKNGLRSFGAFILPNERRSVECVE